MGSIISRAMHVLMLLVKLAALCIPVHVLMMTSVETVKVKLGHLKVVERTPEMERRTSREVCASSAVEEKHIVVVVVKEAVRAENVMEVCAVSRVVKRPVSKLVVLPSFLLVTQNLISCSHKQLISIHRCTHF